MSLGCSASAADRIVGLSLGDHSDQTRIVLDLTGSLPYALFTLADPYRVVIDLPEVAWSATRQSANSNSGLVSGYRFGLFQPGNSRFVLDLRQPARVARAYYLPAANGVTSGATRLVIDLQLTDRESFLKTAGYKGPLSPPIASAPPPGKAALILTPLPEIKAPRPATPPQVAPGHAGGVISVMPPPNPRRSSTPKIEEPPVTHLTAIPLAPSIPAKKRLRVIVIDAGHGGVDPGAITAHGVYEKSIVLDTAQRLQTLLRQDRRYNVIMTRNTDMFVRLGDRVQIARNSEADLFLSIHADALATHKVRGASVYTLSEQASDKEAELLAAKENNSDMIAGIGIGDETDELVKSILIDLAQRETTNKSVHFAKLLLPELNDAGALLKNSHRYAGFRVLKAPDVPSVLVELGLLSNNTDARILTSNAGRQRLAEALRQAIETYFRNFET
ncbi:MAG: N-acetylmuramoyl-L-alanine amidase [Alphaproteobacteria bacterium]